MKTISPEEAQRKYIARREERIKEQIEPKLAKKEAERKEREALNQQVADMVRGRRINHGTTRPVPAESGTEVPENTPETTLPEGWEDGHWKTIVALAKEKGAGEDVTTKDGAVAYLKGLEAE